MSDPKPCTCCGESEERVQSFIPFVGEIRDRIQAEICPTCWTGWMDMQIKVINEYRLHMGEPEHRKVLEEHAARFFRFDGGDGSFDVAGPEGGLLGEPSEAGD
ncbi:MAG: Fe(2+)-trafficking protein [Myxococcota bacterium]|nr:Fe(2+)-trafficking protein [Myxococcota bacterium]